jgi:hypothetical protein
MTKQTNSVFKPETNMPIKGRTTGDRLVEVDDFNGQKG